MRLDAKSVFVGAGGLLAMLICLGAGVPALQNVLRAYVVNQVDVAGIPAPNELVRVEAGESVLVPENQVFVITGVAVTGPGAVNYEVHVDGVRRLAGGLEGVNSINSATDVFFWGYSVGPGSTIAVLTTVSGQGAGVVMLGYWADA